MLEISSVDAAVEKIVQDAPPVEKPVQEAPAEKASAKVEEETPASEKSAEEGAELSAFEQELIEEFKEEYDSLPEDSRPAYLASLKRSYRKQAKQMTELGTLRKAVSALREAGVTNEDLVKLIQDKRGGTKAEARQVVESATATNGKRGYQRWLEQAKTPEERESLRDAEQVVRELVEDLLTSRIEEVREKEVKPLRERLDWQDRQTLTKRAQSLDQDISNLEDKLGYPGSLVETHREAMRNLGLREPDLSVEDLLVRVAGFATVKAAMLKVASKTAETTEEGGTKKPPASVVKKPGQAELPRKTGGSISITRALDLLMKPKR